jgi:mycoredoxin
MPYSNTLSPFGRVIAPPGVPVLVYGTRWCAETMRVRTFLQRLGMGWR